MNKKDFTWVEKRFGTRFANILNSFPLDFNINDNTNKIVTDLEELVTPKYVNESVIEHPIYIDLNTGFELLESYDEPTSSTVTTDSKQAILLIDGDVNALRKNDLLLVQNKYGYEGTNITNQYLVLCIDDIIENDDDTRFKVHAINGKTIGTVTNCVPSLEEGDVFILLTNNVIDFNNPIPEIRPTAIKTYIMQPMSLSFEDPNGTLNGVITKNSKFNNIEKIAYHSFISRRNFTYLFGVMSNVDTTMQGIFKQCGREFFYNLANANVEVFVDIARRAFSRVRYDTSNQKLCLSGGGLLNKFNTLLPNLDTFETTFGTLHFTYFEPFSDINDNYAILLDLNDISLYVKKPLTATHRNGVTTFSEESCMVLNTPRCHMRLIAV